MNKTKVTVHLANKLLETMSKNYNLLAPFKMVTEAPCAIRQHLQRQCLLKTAAVTYHFKTKKESLLHLCEHAI